MLIMVPDCMCWSEILVWQGMFPSCYLPVGFVLAAVQQDVLLDGSAASRLAQ